MKRLLTLLLCLVGAASFAASPSFQQTTNIAKSVTTSQLTSNNVYTGSNYFSGPVTTKTLATTNFMILGTNGVNFVWEDGVVPSVQLVQGGTNYATVMNFSPGTGKGQIQGAQLLANEIHDFNGSSLRIQIDSNLLAGTWTVTGNATVRSNTTTADLTVTNRFITLHSANGTPYYLQSDVGATYAELYRNGKIVRLNNNVGQLQVNANGTATASSNLSVQGAFDLAPLASTTTNLTSVRIWNSNNAALYVRGTNGLDTLLLTIP